MATSIFNYNQPMNLGYQAPAPVVNFACPACSPNPAFGSPASPFGNLGMFQLSQNLMMMEQILMMLLQLMGGGLGQQGATGFDPSSLLNAVGGPAAAAGAGPASGSTGSSAPAQSSGAAPAAPAQESSPVAAGAGASPVNIGPGTKVLEIGDSHTVGTFGDELDSKLRGTGAQVATYASAGASPNWFVNGTPTKYGYSERHTDGSKSTTPYGQSHATPKLEQLIAKEKPSVIVVNLGANFRGASSSGIKHEVSSIGEIAKKHGIPVVWVGPPKSAKDNGNPSSLQNFDQQMKSAVAPYGTYVSSAPFIPKYVGSDGIHFGGAEGNKIARNWADGVFNAITGRG